MRSCAEIPRDIVDDVILTDDASRDDMVRIEGELGLHVIRHDRNRGHGGNQKTCYAAALSRGADIVVMPLAGAGVLAMRLRPEPVLRAAAWAMQAERALGPGGWLPAATTQVAIALRGILPASVGAVACGLAHGIVGGSLPSAVGTLVGQCWSSGWHARCSGRWRCAV